jgi:hypothetical protein
LRDALFRDALASSCGARSQASVPPFTQAGKDLCSAKAPHLQEHLSEQGVDSSGLWRAGSVWFAPSTRDGSPSDAREAVSRLS